MIKKTITIVIIILASMMFLGCEWPGGSGSDPSDPGISNALYNGIWIYIDFTSGGVQYSLEDSLYHESDIEYARIAFTDYEDADSVDLWSYSEQSEFVAEYFDEGIIDTLYDGLYLRYIGSGELFGHFDWSVNEDTLTLSDYNDPDRYYRLVDSETWPGWEPDLLDIGYNGDWVFIDYVAFGESRPLEENLYGSTATDWAVMEFRNFEDAASTDTWHYVEQNQLVSNIESAGGDLIDEGLLKCMLEGTSTVYWTFTWSLEPGDTLHLSNFLDPYVYYRLIPEANFVEPGPPMKDVPYNGGWIYESYYYYGVSYPLEDSLYISPDTEWASLELSDFFYDETQQDTWAYRELDMVNNDLYSIDGEMTADEQLLLEWYDAGQDEWVEWNNFTWTISGGQDKLYLYNAYDSNIFYVLVPE